MIDITASELRPHKGDSMSPENGIGVLTRINDGDAGSGQAIVAAFVAQDLGVGRTCMKCPHLVFHEAPATLFVAAISGMAGASASCGATCPRAGTG